MKRILCVGEGYALSRHTPNYRNIRYISLLAVLTIMCLYAVKQVSARKAEPAATAVENITPLQIGDTIPEWLWHRPLQVVNHPEGENTITLNDYRGKLIILDFWGTFCSSCIAAMPKINEVQEQFNEKMIVLPVSWSKPIATEEMLISHKTLTPLKLFSIVEAEQLIELFPHGVVPHYAWINPQGRVVATTATNDVSFANVAKVLQGKQPDFTIAKFIDTNEPLLFSIDDLPKGTDLKQFSVFIRGRIPGLPSAARLRKNGDIVSGMAIFNRRISAMYPMIIMQMIGEHPGKRLVVVDSITDDTPCTFDFVVPANQADSVFRWMLDMLNQSTEYTCRLVRRKRPCLLLTMDGDKETRAGKNFEEKDNLSVIRHPIDKLVSRLNWNVISGDRLVVNNTGYEGSIAIDLPAPSDDAAEIQKQLNLHGLALTEADHEVEVFEIRRKSH